MTRNKYFTNLSHFIIYTSLKDINEIYPNFSLNQCKSFLSMLLVIRNLNPIVIQYSKTEHNKEIEYIKIILTREQGIYLKEMFDDIILASNHSLAFSKDQFYKLFKDAEDLEKLDISGYTITYSDYFNRFDGDTDYLNNNFSLSNIQGNLSRSHSKFRHNLLQRLVRRYNLKVEKKVLNTNCEEDPINSILLGDKSYLRNIHDDYTLIRTKNNVLNGSNIMFINPNTATLLNKEVVGVDTLLKLFNIDEKNLYRHMYMLSNKQLINVLLVGLGGTMSNFVYFANELVKYFKLEPIFGTMYVVEDDDLDVTNLPRIPLNYVSNRDTKVIRTISKLNLLSGVNNLSNVTIPIYGKLATVHALQGIGIVKKPLSFYKNENITNCSKVIGINYVKDIKKEYYTAFPDNWVKKFGINTIIGSPSLDVRDELSKLGVNYLCPLHTDNSIVIYRNIDLSNISLNAESYGSIDLNVFLLNMFKMTVELIMNIKPKYESLAEEKILDYSVLEDEEIKSNSKLDKQFVIF